MADAWETFGRKIMEELWDGALELAGYDVEQWALDAGITVVAPYDPAIHGDAPDRPGFDVEPGDMIYTYAPDYARAPAKEGES